MKGGSYVSTGALRVQTWSWGACNDILWLVEQVGTGDTEKFP